MIVSPRKTNLMSGLMKASKAAVALSAVCVVAFIPLDGVRAQEAISFQQVLASPDDTQLNLDYARQQVAAGNLQQASAALERLLLAQPNWDSVRLFYGIVLYRLDDLSGAKRELKLLEGRDLSPKQEGERRKYLALAEQASRRVRMSARFSLGLRTDSNPGRLNDEVDLFDVEDGPDSAFTGASQFRIEVDFQNGRGDFAFVQIGGVFNQYFEIGRADFAHFPVKAGVTLHRFGGTITPYVLASHSIVQNEEFRSETGGGIDTNWSINAQLDWFLNGFAQYQDYDETSFSIVGDLRDGWLYGGKTGLRWRPSDRQTFTLSGSVRRKDAEGDLFAPDGFSYDFAKIELSSLTLLGGGFYLNAKASYSQTNYDEVDFFTSFSDIREDERFYARVAVGAPLSALFTSADIELPEAIADIVAQVGVSYTDQNSSISNLTFDNWSGDLLFTKRVQF
ncbi:MAG: porin family protein [Pseudomonadota bacterium]